MSQILVCANLGGIDPIWPLPSHQVDLQSVYYTDKGLDEDMPSALTWDRFLSLPEHPNPRLAAKFYKCQIHRLDSTADAERLVWCDSAFRFSSLEFLERDYGKCAMFVPHPDRMSVAEEYEYVLRQVEQGNPYLSARYDPGPLEAERDYFSRRHKLASLPLWCGGLWSVPRTEAAYRFLDSWWDIVQRFSILDQTSLTPLLVEAGLEVEPLDVSIYRSPWFERVHHA